MKTFLKNNWQNGLFLALGLWLAVWATYNTDVFRIFNPGFPHSLFDLAHGLRAVFPFIAFLIALFLLVKDKRLNFNLLKGPLGMLLIFSLIGIVASLFSAKPALAVYWGSLYLLAIIVMLAISTDHKNIKAVMNLSWIIAGTITIALVVFFFVQTGTFSQETLKSFLMGQRPFESMGNVKAQDNFFGMPGTRPTGLGRFAGIVAIIAFAGFWVKNKKSKTISTILFALFSLILIFSRARTSIVAFVASILLVGLFQAKNKTNFIVIVISIALILIPTGFYNFSFKYLMGENLLLEMQQINNNIQGIASGENQFINQAVTLSGRTEGVWEDVKSLFLSSPIIGKGFHADRIYLNGQHAHNSVWHALVQAGILGTAFFILAFVTSWLILLRFLKTGFKDVGLICSLGALAYFTVRGITESTAYFGADYLFLLPVFAYLQFYPKEKSINNKMDFNGLKVDVIKINEVLDKINYWVKNESQKRHQIIVTGMHGAVEASRHVDFRYILNSADLWVPDGISLVWLARFKGFDIKERISGTDLMQEVFKKDYKHFLYGDTQEILDAVKNKFSNKSIEIFSPPFRELTKEEDEQIIEKINQARPDILWVGLGLPKQERWIYKHTDKLNVPVIIGVGAAFKFLSGKVKRAPKWVGKIGLEWLWRLVKEPKRVWRRVFIDMPYFFWLVVKDLFS